MFNSDIDRIFNEIFTGFNDMARGIEIRKPYSRESFLNLYFNQATDLDRRAIEILSYMIIEASKSEDKIFHGTYDALMARFGVSRNVIADAMKRLQDGKYIERVSNGWKISEKIQLPEGDGTITINFTNDKKEKPEIPEKIDTDLFEKYAKAYVLSYTQLNKEAKNINAQAMKELIQDYNASLDKENPVSLEQFLEDRHAEALTKDCIISYNQLVDNGLDYDEFTADIACKNEQEILDIINKYIDETAFTNENKFLVKEKMYMLIKTLSNVFGPDKVSLFMLKTLLFNTNGQGNLIINQIAKKLSVRSNSRDSMIMEACMNWLKRYYQSDEFNSEWSNLMRSAINYILMTKFVVNYNVVNYKN